MLWRGRRADGKDWEQREENWWECGM
uniref:Uncharacterized protein n=1 Tax=Arundo donax TaxID=35708 RepID=A0A0A9AEZ7_ARUDO